MYCTNGSTQTIDQSSVPSTLSNLMLCNSYTNKQCQWSRYVLNLDYSLHPPFHYHFHIKSYGYYLLFYIFFFFQIYIDSKYYYNTNTGLIFTKIFNYIKYV